MGVGTGAEELICISMGHRHVMKPESALMSRDIHPMSKLQLAFF